MFTPTALRLDTHTCSGFVISPISPQSELIFSPVPVITGTVAPAAAMMLPSIVSATLPPAVMPISCVTEPPAMDTSPPAVMVTVPSACNDSAWPACPTLPPCGKYEVPAGLYRSNRAFRNQPQRIRIVLDDIRRCLQSIGHDLRRVRLGLRLRPWCVICIVRQLLRRQRVIAYFRQTGQRIIQFLELLVQRRNRRRVRFGGELRLDIRNLCVRAVERILRGLRRKVRLVQRRLDTVRIILQHRGRRLRLVRDILRVVRGLLRGQRVFKLRTVDIEDTAGRGDHAVAQNDDAFKP